MTITIEVAPEKERRLQEEAQRVGLPISEYVVHMIDQLLTEPPVVLPPQEDWDALLDALAEESENRPILAEDTFHRSSFYGERG